MPAGDVDLFDEEAQQLLFLVEVEVVDDAADPVGEVVDAAAELVVAGERCALFGEAGSFGCRSPWRAATSAARRCSSGSSMSPAW